MADVRSLLRSELASRKGSPQTGSSTPNRVTKKRKVDPTETITRKKLRHTNTDQLLSAAQIRPPSAQLIAEEKDDGDDVEALPQDVMTTDTDTPTQHDITEEIVETTIQPLETPSIAPAGSTKTTQTVDEDEWAAFEREVVAPSRVPQRLAAVAAAATISAAPVTIEEIAELQEKEKETMRQNREAEVEGEREDAARFLEEEFDEMEQLEERVRRLKQMREQLRMKRATESAEMDEGAVTRDVAAGAEKVPSPAEAASIDNKDDEDEDEDEDDDEEEDDWDNWRFR
ncbi:hypothetical protein BDW59DRAFT_55024 [Aspergillus cavernicola]|uniref:Uncharacterized protein n=1 Tax=Aspergillus cavernicola TaxID=176166 RepID=A0ABR4IJC1_9EURO